jgi:nucleotidyltransferase/DNA polymerase involved in DNA repair
VPYHVSSGLGRAFSYGERLFFSSQVPRDELVSRFGPRLGAQLGGLSRGLDPSPVTPQGPPRSISVEDSFRAGTSLHAAQVGGQYKRVRSSG